MTQRRVAAALAILLAAAAGLSLLHVLAARPEPVIRAQSRQLGVLPALSKLSAAQLAALPEARYDAVIAALLPAAGAADADTAYRLKKDTVLYAADRATPIARLAARDFLGEPSIVVPVESSGDWLRVLTPARQRLPSTGANSAGTNSLGALAPAQTSAWLRADSLSSPTMLVSRIIVSVSAQTLRIIGVGNRTWPVGVGAPGTPTPVGVTGYLQARYRDAAQGQAEHPIQLTSLHSTAADEPFGGNDGGLIGIHFQASASGARSHGCIRVPLEALAAVDALPLGTLITIEG
ncbi:MAG: L,D-transpeptidase [Candidatus Saccharibacteria bacterium]|nr:L,D-transpeptidase [Microbacteriaceae bacterium]